MILAYANELLSKGYDPAKNLFVVAWDVDIFCTYMAYFQLSMYDIPAIVVNGDTLSLKENFVLYTPAYYIFKKLKEEGKLNTPICQICKKYIEKKKYKSNFNPDLEICNECYITEKRLLILKKLMN